MAMRLPRAVRIGLWSFLALVLVVIAGGAIFALSFDPNSLKPRIIAAVKQETGRDLTLEGPVRLGLSLQPTLVVQGASLANPPGFSRPQMATLSELHLKLGLIPLLRHSIEINQLVLIKPDILLETDAQGHPNWQFDKEARAVSPQPVAAGTPQEKTPTRISIAQVQIQDGIVTWRDDKTSKTAVIGLKNLTTSEASPDANLHFAAKATYNGAPVTVNGELGPLARLEEPGATAPWPIQVALETAGAKLTADGTITQPLQGRGYAMKVAADVPDLNALAPLLPGSKLPSLHDVKLAAQVADKGGKLPEISGLTLHIGASDLTQLASLKLEKLDVSAPKLDQPVQVSGQGTFDDAPLTLAGSMGAPATLLPGGKPAQPIPIDVTLQALGSSVAIKGSAARGQDGRPSFQGAVTSNMIDADRLAAALRKPRAASAPGAAPTAPAAPASKPAGNGHVIPDTPIPFDMLRLADGDVKLSMTELKWGGATYRNISSHLELRGSTLRMDPISVDSPEGHLNAAITADASHTPEAVSLRIQAPALAAQPLFAAVGEPGLLSGNLQADINVHGAGGTPHAIASSLDGTISLIMTNGTVDNRLLGSTLGSILRAVNSLDLVGRGGNSEIQCFVTRLDANHGIAAVRPLLLRSSMLTMDGDGSVNFGTETLDLRIRPQGRVGGNELVVPLRVTGSFRSPTAAPDPAAAVAENAGTVAGAVLGNTSPLGIVAGALGGQKLLGTANAPDCASALALVRGQPAPPQPARAAPAAPASQAKPKPPDIGGVLKQLLR